MCIILLLQNLFEFSLIREFMRLTWSIHLFSTTDKSCSLLHSNITVLHKFLHVRTMILWSMVCGSIQGISNLHLLNFCNLRYQRYIFSVIKINTHLNCTLESKNQRQTNIMKYGTTKCPRQVILSK